MKESEKVLVTSLITLLLTLWLGFLIHRDPRFPGSLLGGILGITGATLMSVPLVYLLIKRIPFLHQRMTKRLSMRTLLTIHIYAGILGPIFALLHSGHKFQSPMGIALTALMLIVVMSGFIGRYLLSYVSQDVREKKAILNQLEQEYHAAALSLQDSPGGVSILKAFRGFFAHFFRGFSPSLQDFELSPAHRVVYLSESIADVEYALKTDDLFRKIFSIWLKLHIVLSTILYSLLLTHIGSEIYFGLRWLR